VSKWNAPRVCVVCEMKYIPNTSRQKTCGEVCCYQLKLQNSKKYRAKNRAILAERTCASCKKSFQPYRKDNRYCSKKCGNQKRDRTLEKFPKKCAECNQEFIPRNSRAILCSEPCRYVHEKRKAVIRGRINQMPFSIPEKKCAVCNAIFKPKTGVQKYCSPSCNNDATQYRSWRTIQNSPIRPKTCLHCKGEFMPKTRKSMAKFCSHACRGGYQAGKRQEKIDELRKEQKNQVELQKKWDDSSIQIRDCPPDTAYAKEIWAYLKKGKTITKYLHPIWAAGSTINEEEEELIELEN